jgi:hypothetical protein
VELADDDSKRVSEGAARALAGATSASSPRPAAVTPPPVRSRPAAASRLRGERSSSTTSQLAIRLARAAQRKDALALGGAALIVLGYFRSASWDTAWKFAIELDEIWALWSPLEAYGTALLVAAAVLASRRGRLAREAADGMLLGVGLIVLAAMGGFVASVFEFAGAAALTVAGAVAIGAAGALGVLTHRAPEVGLTRRSWALAAAGAGLGFAPLVVNVAYWSDSGLLEDWGGSFYIEVLAACAATVVALLFLIRMPRARLRAAGALTAIGALLALHYVGLMIQIAKYEGVDALRLGGALGVAGGLVLVGAGLHVLRGMHGATAPGTASVPAS